MKNRLFASAAIFLTFACITFAFAQTPVGVDPQTGLPINPSTGQPVPTIDPATGQPIPTPSFEWIDPKWPDPGTVLTNVDFDGLPLGDIVNRLRSQFKDKFDVILPRSVTNPNGEPLDAYAIEIRLRLQNVRASEIFNAMNLYFEVNQLPVRWQLLGNGGRPTALLRPLQVSYGTEPKEYRVFFIGNLIGDPKNGGLTLEQIIKTLNDVWSTTENSSGQIQFHKDAQLLVVTGTHRQVDLVNQTLIALKTKVEGQESTPRKTSETGSSFTERLKKIQEQNAERETGGGSSSSSSR